MPSCPNCNTSVQVPFLYATSLYPQACTSAASSCVSSSNGTQDAKCVIYNGPRLPCSDIDTATSLEDILINFDTKLCSVLADFSVYNTGCIGSSMTEQGFVEAISSYVCTTRTDLDDFINDTFPDYQVVVDTRFDAIESPALICASANILSSDTLSQVYAKYCAKFSAIDTALSLSGVNWAECFTVSPLPSTIAQGFSVVLDQICSLKTDITASPSLPTFNNTGSCLGGTLTASDTLVDTVNKIKTRLCTTPTFDINALTWGCTAKPSTDPTNLQAAFQSVLSKVNDYIQNKLTFTGDFSVSLTNPGDPCQGKTVALATPSSQDRFFALSSSDTAPGVWNTKVLSGTGITFDYSTTPGSVIINAASGSSTDTQVKVRSADPTTGYLEDKIKGSASSSGITVTKTTDVGDMKVQIGTTINFEILWESLLTYLDDNPETKELFCEYVSSCLPDCITPPNVTVVYNQGNTTTSTTTTSTTTV